MKKANPRTGSTAGILALAAVVLAFAAIIALTACDTATGGGGDDIVSISVTGPAKTSYPQGAAFSSAGLAVTARYSDGTTALVTSGVSLSWNGQALADGAAAITADPGVKTVNVGWRGRAASFSLLVVGADDSIPPITSTALWNSAVQYIGGNGNTKSYVLTINGSFGIPPSNFGGVNDLVVTLKGSGTLTLTGNGSIFALLGSSPEAQQKLIIDGNVTLKGKTGNNAPLVQVGRDAALDMKGGAITGNSNTGLWGDSGVEVVDGGSFTMSGGVITGNGNTGGWGSGVAVGGGGSFTMTDGLITGNTGGWGGGVAVNMGGSVIMSGGIISGNIVTGDGGGVHVGHGGSFTLTGNGKITGNTGGGVSANDGGDENDGNYAGGSITMTGGEISGNTGAGVDVYNGSFTMSDGKISGNTTNEWGGGGVRFNGSNGIFIMTGGEITGNIVTSNGGGGGVLVAGGSSFTLSGNGKITGNSAPTGGGVLVEGSGTFSKTGGVINGDTDHTPGDTENTATNDDGGQVWGHAVFYNGGSDYYYRNATLGAGDDISTDTLPPSGTGHNWTKK
ncbi:MAG: bacterial Ig-like domain-containing protein [Treponema sp.]|jgi:hypothetical protein|nr:bacterial Ig-like domain-containing protein [Treponema sp.]